MTDKKLKQDFALRQREISKLESFEKIADEVLPAINLHTHLKCRYIHIDKMYIDILTKFRQEMFDGYRTSAYTRIM